MSSAINLILGGVYYNAQHHEVIIQYLDADDNVGYDQFIEGDKKVVIDSTVTKVRELLETGGYKLDHIDAGW